jgi:ABC-2 type transport system permease protein
VLLFTYVMGGAIKVGTSSDPTAYKQFLMAGIFAQTVTFAVAGASAGIAEDMTKGLVDRFRSLPMARSAVLVGRTLADLVQTALTLVVLGLVAFLIGWRIHKSVLEALCGFLLLLLLGYAFSWIGALIGLSVRSPEAATSAGLVWLFPLTFISNAPCPGGCRRSPTGTRSARPCRRSGTCSATCRPARGRRSGRCSTPSRCRSAGRC